MVHTLVSPLRLVKKNGKFFAINLNIYRNSHYRTLHTVKILYKELMRKQILSLPKLNKVAITYVVYPKTKRRFDLGNLTAIQQKFFEDACVELGILEDDDYTHVIETTQRFGIVDKNNPRVEVLIKEIP